MKRLAVLFTALALLAAAPADRIVKLTLDGRPVDRHGDTALSHGGVVYGDLVDLVKSFDGLLTFQGKAAVVTIGGHYGRFTIGSRTAIVDQGSVTMPGRVFVRNGDYYVPLATFVRGVAHAKLTVARDGRSADIVVNANPVADPTP